jgi:hypothetical protein
MTHLIICLVFINLFYDSLNYRRYRMYKINIFKGKKTLFAILLLITFVTIATDLTVVGGCDGGTWEFDSATNTLICDNNPLPPTAAGILSFNPTSYSATEGQMVIPRISRSAGSNGEVSIEVSLKTGSALEQDFINPGKVILSWADGETGSKSYKNILLVDDSKVEPTEAFFVTMSKPTGDVAIKNNSTSVSILDNDTTQPPPPPTSCHGKRLINLDYGVQSHAETKNRTMVSGEAYAVRFVTNNTAKYIRVSLVEFAGDIPTRTMTVSKRPCDFTLTGQPASVGIQTSLILSNGFDQRGYQRIEKNSEYYINFTNEDMLRSPGIDTCKTGRKCGFHLVFHQQ